MFPICSGDWLRLDWAWTRRKSELDLNSSVSVMRRNARHIALFWFLISQVPMHSWPWFHTKSCQLTLVLYWAWSHLKYSPRHRHLLLLSKLRTSPTRHFGGQDQSRCRWAFCDNSVQRFGKCCKYWSFIGYQNGAWFALFGMLRFNHLGMYVFTLTLLSPPMFSPFGHVFCLYYQQTLELAYTMRDCSNSNRLPKFLGSVQF